MADQHTFSYPPELLEKQKKQREAERARQQQLHEQRQLMARKAAEAAGFQPQDLPNSGNGSGLEILPDDGTDNSNVEVPPGYTPPQPPQQNVRGVNPNAPKPTISPALQKHIEKRIKEAEEMKNPLTSEVVFPEGATTKTSEPPISPKKDASATNLALPSRFAFYEFQDIFLGRLKARHYGKLHESHISQSYEALLEVMSDILTTTHPNWQDKPLAFYLTIPDFYFILFYLRLNQVKSPLLHSTFCDNPDHILEVANKSKPEDTLKIDATVEKSFLHTKILGAVPDTSQFTTDRYSVQPARMIDVVEAINIPEYATDADLRYMCRVASMLKLHNQPDAPLMTRLMVAEDLEYDELSALGAYERMVSDYGTQESINVTCKDCGHQRRTKVTLDARSFLPIR